jgi:hypothetical protein
MQVHVRRFIAGAVVISGLLFSQGLVAQEGQEAQEESKPKVRTIQTRDPRTGRTITQQVPVADGAALVKLRVQRYRERCEFSDEQWQGVEPLLTTVMELQAALKPVPAARFRTAVPDGELSRTPEDDASLTAELKIAYDSLTEAARHPDATDEEIAQKMQAYTQKRQQAETELQAAKLQLAELLSTRQQAQLMLEGVL